MPYRSHDDEHAWMVMENPPLHRLCYVCGRIEDPDGNLYREGAT